MQSPSGPLTTRAPRLIAALLLAAALAGLAAAQTPAARAPLSTPAWVQLAAGGRDASASHDGQRWFIGSDGRARRWLASRNAWVVHGSRSDLVRIDAGPAGAAAITSSGDLVVSSTNEGDDWRALGVRAADVGIGGGRLWLADARLADGGFAVLHAPFDASGRTPTWQRLERRFVRIDVDPSGRAWALDAEGRLFMFPFGSGTQWLAQTGVPAAADVGAGGNGAVLVVASATDAAFGGGAVYQRVPAGGPWRLLPGRLASISVDAEGRAFGTNSQTWVLGSVAAAAGEPLVPGGPPSPEPQPEGDGTPATTLAALAGSAIELPPAIAAAPVVRVSGDVARGTFVGRTRLNGLVASVVRYTPPGATQAVLALGHETLAFGDYVPELIATGLQALRLTQAVFFFVAPGQTARAPSEADATLLNRVFSRTDLAQATPPAGLSLLASVDVRQIGPFSAVTAALGVGSSTVAVGSENLSPALFTSVVPGTTKPVATPTTWAAFRAKYGEAMLRNLVLRAPARELDGRTLGPLAIKSPLWSLSASPSDAGVALVIALDTALELKLRAATAGAVNETLAVRDARLTVEPLTRTASLTGSITRDAAASVASLRSLQLQSATFEGQVVIGSGVQLNAPLPLETLQMVVNAKGQLPSLRFSSTSSGAATAGAGTPVALDLQLSLALDEAKTALVPTVRASGELTLADLSGIDSPAARGVKLQEVEWTPGTLAGRASLYGLSLRAVRHQEGTAAPVVGLYHQELDLGTYIPRLHRTTTLGTLGLANAVAYVLPENAPARVFNTRAEMPAALAALLNRPDVDDQIFPLTLAPGVTVIGHIDTAGSATPGLTNRVLAAWGLDDQRYVVKGSFKASALRNASFESASQSVSSGVREVRNVSARDVACAVSTAGENLQTEGLDVSFRVPNFRPPGTGNNLQFSDTRFAVKEVEGQLEPALVTAVRIRLPRQMQGLGPAELGLAAKLQVRGDWSVLCQGITPAANGELTIAGATAFNTEQIANVALSALQRVTAEEAPAAAGAATGSPSSGLTAGANSALSAQATATVDRLTRLIPSLAGLQRKPGLGWRRAFGLPFLTVHQFALSGTIGQQDGKLSLSGTVWTDSVLGSERVDALGRLSIEAADPQADFALTDWLMKVPSPVKLTGLPGMAQLNQRLPALELSDLTVSQLSLAPTEMTGTLALPSRAMQGTALFRLGPDGTEEAPAFELFAGVNRFAPNWLLKPNAQIPGAAGELTLGSSFFALRGAATVEQQKVGDLPGNVKNLLSGAAGPLLGDDATFPLVRGLSLAGRVTPGEIPDTQALAPIKSLFTTLGLTAPVPVFGGVEAAAPDSASTQIKGSFLETLITNLTVPGLPSGSAASVRNLRVSLSSRDGRRITGTGQGTFTLPASLRATLGQTTPNNANVQFAYERSTQGDTLMQWSAATDVAWPSALSLPGLRLGNLDIEVETRQSGSQPVSSSFQVSAVGSYGTVAVKARLRSEQLAAGGGAAGGNLLVELESVEPGGRLNLATLLNPLQLLPAGYDGNAAPSVLFKDLTASKLLLAREAGTGRITLAAVDVVGKLREQDFSGQLAVVGITGSPVLFLRSNAPLVAGRVFGPMVQASPLGDVSLPQGLVILSPSRANLNLSQIHREIADKVFADLNDSGTAELLANEGLTVLARVDVPGGLPAAMQELVPWLPSTGRLLLGAGVESAAAGGTRTLALFARAMGMNLRIPDYAQTVVKSAGGDVLFTLRSVGTGAQALTEAGLQTGATVLVPRLTRPGSREVNTQISLSARRQGNGDADTLLRVETDLSLPGWLSLPQVTAKNLGLEVASQRRGSTNSNSVVLSADATVATVKAKARLGLNKSDGAFDGGLVELIAAEDGGRFDLATLLAPLNVPAQYGLLVPNVPLSPWNYLKSFSTSGVLLAQAAGTGTLEVAARDVRGQLNQQEFRGQFAAVVRPAGPVLFVRSDTPLTAARVFPSQIPLGPFGALGLPEGLVILSPQNGDVNLSTLHPRIYEDVFASFFDSPASAIVPAKNGLAVLAKLNLGSALPAPLNLMSGWLPGGGKLIVGGGIEDAGSTAPKLAFYASVQGLTLRVPPPLDNFVQTVGGNVVFFFKTKGGTGAGAELGLQTAVKLKAPRLDTLEQQPVDATLDITAASETGSPAELTLGATVNGTWNQPLGLSGFALTNTSVDLGTSATGFVVNINSERAEFTTSGGEKKSMVLDLFSTWTPAGVPSKLSVQMAKSPSLSGDLVLTPSVYAELVNSVVQLGMKSGSALAGKVREQLAAASGTTSGPTQAALNVFDGFASRLNTAGTTAMSLMRYTPLGLIGVKNPTVFFATPGNEPPRRQGVEQPPFGLGLRMSGQLILDTGRHTLDVAAGVVKVDLLNGFSVSGTVTPPSPFGSTSLALSGSQPLLQATPSAMRLSGTLAVPGLTLPNGSGASVSGHFDFVRSPLLPLPTDLNVTGSLSLAGLTSRSASLDLRGTTLTVYSAPEACVDIPLKLDGSLTLPSLNPAEIVALVKPGSLGTAVLNCSPGWAKDVVAAVGAAASVAGDTAKAAVGVVMNGVAEVPVVGGPATQAATTAFNAGKAGVTAARDVANRAVNDVTQAILNPTQAPTLALTAAKDALNAANAALESAVDALSNLGCKIFSWLPGDHYCRKRERARRAARDDAERRRNDRLSELAQEIIIQSEANKARPFQESERKRVVQDMERRTVLNLERTAAVSERAKVGEFPGAAACPHDQLWNPALRNCSAPDVGLVVYSLTSTATTRCLSRAGDFNGAALSVANCANRDAMYWRLTVDRQLQAVTRSGAVAGSQAMCVPRPEGGNPVAELANGTELVLRPCTQANTRNWAYTASGQFRSPANNCVAVKTNDRLEIKACTNVSVPEGQLQWTPAVPRDLVGLAELPRTLRLQVGGTGLCVKSDGEYPDAYYLGACNDNDLDQDFTFGFEDGTRFVIQSRHSRLCMASGPYHDATAEKNLMAEPCFASDAQKFSLNRLGGGRLQFVNVGSGKCLAVVPNTAGGAVAAGDTLNEVACNGGDANQAFQPMAIASIAGRAYRGYALQDAASARREAIQTVRNDFIYRPVRLRVPGSSTERCFGRDRSGPRDGSVGQYEAIEGSEDCRWLVVVPGRDNNGPNRVSLAHVPQASNPLGGGTIGPTQIADGWHEASVLRQFGSPTPAVVWSPVRLGDGAWDGQVSFEMGPPLAGPPLPGRVSLASPLVEGGYVMRRGNGLVVAVPVTQVDRENATFLLERAP